jgi:hypothetical protein
MRGVLRIKKRGSGTLPKDKLGQSWHIVFVIRTVSAF